MKPAPKMEVSPSPSTQTRFQSFLKPDWNLELPRGFSFNSVSPSLKPTNNKKKKEIRAKFQGFTSAEQSCGDRARPTSDAHIQNQMLCARDRGRAGIGAGGKQTGFPQSLPSPSPSVEARTGTSAPAATAATTTPATMRSRGQGTGIGAGRPAHVHRTKFFTGSSLELFQPWPSCRGSKIPQRALFQRPSVRRRRVSK